MEMTVEMINGFYLCLSSLIYASIFFSPDVFEDWLNHITWDNVILKAVYPCLFSFALKSLISIILFSFNVTEFLTKAS